MPRKIRSFTLKYNDPKGQCYFDVSLAAPRQRARVARKVGLKRDEPLLAIDHFWVSPALRGTGMGKELMRRLAGALDALGHACALYVLPYDNGPLDTKALVKFYESFGWKLIGKVGPKDPDNWSGCPLMVKGVV